MELAIMFFISTIVILCSVLVLYIKLGKPSNRKEDNHLPKPIKLK